ncbi:MAG: DEAD/DEAH box helicase [Bacteroidales bacterium]|jgi:ATP-dependent RNA helicase RhlE|nr:DEAD/DEAH box helicase [Bacteroidales bacterium]
MNTFEKLNLSMPLRDAIADLGFEKPTPIQSESFSVILSGRDVVGIAQTGTGKTLAYVVPLLRDLNYSKHDNPTILILVPTRELVKQVVENIESLAKYQTLRVLGVYGGTNINTQKQAVIEGMDILVATPGRLYDLAVSKALLLKDVKKLVIDEVDVMLDQGFRFQLANIFDLLPKRRQNIMFSATMTEEVDMLIDEFFVSPERISIAVSGTPLHNIAQQCYAVPNFYTKVNLLKNLLNDKNEFRKVLVFVSNKKGADRLYSELESEFKTGVCLVHSNKSQNYRFKSIQQFDDGISRVIVSTDIMARGLDLDKITHVINFDTPVFPENYMHRIGRTGRAEQEGKSILFYTPKEEDWKEAIEKLMSYTIPLMTLPEDVEISEKLLHEESNKMPEIRQRDSVDVNAGGAFHEKKEKNKKVNLGGSYKRDIAKKYKKPRTKGDKNYNKGKKRK